MDAIRKLLTETKVWAVIGCSPDPYRASHDVARYLIGRGFDVIPINPKIDEWLGRKCYPDLTSVPEAIDVVDIFRRADMAGSHVDEAIEVGARGIWMQLGVVDHGAARRAQDAGLDVVMDRCPKIELPRLDRS